MGMRACCGGGMHCCGSCAAVIQECCCRAAFCLHRGLASAGTCDASVGAGCRRHMQQGVQGQAFVELYVASVI